MPTLYPSSGIRSTSSRRQRCLNIVVTLPPKPPQLDKFAGFKTITLNLNLPCGNHVLADTDAIYGMFCVNCSQELAIWQRPNAEWTIETSRNNDTIIRVQIRNWKFCEAGMNTCIVKILSLYSILLYTHWYHFFPVSIPYLQRIQIKQCKYIFQL